MPISIDFWGPCELPRSSSRGKRANIQNGSLPRHSRAARYLRHQLIQLGTEMKRAWLCITMNGFLNPFMSSVRTHRRNFANNPDVSLNT